MTSRRAAAQHLRDLANQMTRPTSFLPHDDPDASPAFSRDRPEVVPAVLLLLRAAPG